MNIRKPVDYSNLYSKLDAAMSIDKDQMALYFEIGKAICDRSEKGAAVAAAEYLEQNYANISGFSPRNVRRMREFYRTYAAFPDVMKVALLLGWTQNVVILESDLSMEDRAWYIRAAQHFSWSKLELMENIKNRVHETLSLDMTTCSIEETITVFPEKPMSTTNNSNIVRFADFNDYNIHSDTIIPLSQSSIHPICECSFKTMPDPHMAIIPSMQRLSLVGLMVSHIELCVHILPLSLYFLLDYVKIIKKITTNRPIRYLYWEFESEHYCQ